VNAPAQHIEWYSSKNYESPTINSTWTAVQMRIPTHSHSYFSYHSYHIGWFLALHASLRQQFAVPQLPQLRKFVQQSA
jgi:hypothetical protein